jgi:hypothetical protein
MIDPPSASCGTSSLRPIVVVSIICIELLTVAIPVPRLGTSIKVIPVISTVPEITQTLTEPISQAFISFVDFTELASSTKVDITTWLNT